jgi:PAB1-binding protein PBP1
MTNETRIKQSNAMKKIWKEKREQIMESRRIHKLTTLEKQSLGIKSHFEAHPEHRTAISKAQKKRWRKINNALRICKELGIDLDY